MQSYHLMFALGLFISFMLGALQNYHLLMALGMTPALIQVVSISLKYGESPLFLMFIGDRIQAELSMREYFRIENSEGL